jgi:tetratricopeptide (TPR) repeat protein
MKTLRFILLIFFVLTSGRTFAYEKVVQEQAGQGNWRDVERILQREEQRCRQAADPENCLDKINFSRAWTYSRQAAQDAAHRDAYLQRARDGYLAILERHPKHLPTIDNLLLVLEQLGDRRQLEHLLRPLQGLEDNTRYIKTALMLAGLYSEEGNNNRAFGYYSRAFALEPSQRALNGLLAIYRKSPDEGRVKQIEAFAERSQNFTMRRRLYEAILQTRNKVTQRQWENAAINWVALLGKERQLTAKQIEKDIEVGIHPEFRELAKRLQEPHLGLSPGDLKIGDMTLLEYRRAGWWNDNLLRTWAFTIAAWSEGHNRLLNNDIKAANDIWTAALQFAPPSYVYDSDELKGRWAVSLELLTDLARIQRLYKRQIDPAGQTFARIEQVLFFSKAQAYQVNDLQAIQRHHTVMGKMYADLGVFSERKTGVRSAEFQLKHAIETAKARSGQTGKADPQPQLAQLMADGYSCRLPSQKSGCKVNPDKAQVLYLQAAQGYLKLDAVLPATMTLQKIKVTNPQTKIKVKQLETMINLRSSLTDDYLIKGKDHPDVVTKQIDIANQWTLMGETVKAQDSLDRVLPQERQPIGTTKVYEQLKAGKIETLKTKALQLRTREKDRR